MKRSWAALLLVLVCSAVVIWSLSQSHPGDAALEGASLTQDGPDAADALDRPSTSPGVATERPGPTPDGRVAAERGAPPIVDASGVLHCIVQLANGEPVPDIRVSGQDGSRWIDATTDRWGRVRFEAIDEAFAIGAFHLYGSNWLTLHRSTPHARPDGSWTPLVITLTQAAELSIRVLTEAGTALPDREVSVELSPDEPLGRRRSDLSGRPQLPHRRGMTDEDGRVTIGGVPAGLRLLVRIDDATLEWWNPATGELARSRERAVPLVLAERQRTELTMRIGTNVRVDGIVKLPDGKPAQRTRVRIFHIHPGGTAHHRLLGEATTNENGSFRILAFTSEAVTELALSAGDSPPHPDHGLIDFGIYSGGRASRPAPAQPGHSTAHAAWADVLLDSTGSAFGLEVTLRELESIQGTVRDQGGEPVAAEVWLRPAGWSEGIPGAQLAHMDHDGSFLFARVLPGTYELEARAHGYRSASSSSIEVGEADVELVLRLEPPAKVEVFVHGPDVSFAGAVHYRRHAADSLEAKRAMKMPSQLQVSGEWDRSAEGARRRARWSWNDLGDTGSQELLTQLMTPDIHRTTLALQPGAISFGIVGAFSSKGWNYPMSSPPVRIESGTSEIHFYLRGSGRVNGVVRGARPDMALCVALALKNGVLLPLDVGRDELRGWTDLAGSGEFRWDSVPEGHFELRVGTRDVLQAGGALLRQSIEVVAGETLQLELQL